MAQAQIRQADYTDYSNSFNELDFVIRQRISNINTAIVVKVVKVKTDTKSVDVLPMVQQISADGSVIDHGTVYNIPYFMLQGGVNAILINPAIDDIGLLVCCSRDISGVKNAKQVAPPSSRRMHTFSDGLYIGGFLNQDPTRFIEFNDSGINVVPIEKFKYNGIEVATVNDVAAERARAEAAESAEAARASAAENAEKQRATTNEDILQAEIIAEIARAKAAEAAEKARAEAAEYQLHLDIVAETTRAEAAETVLAAAIVAETTRAQTAENQLHLDIVAEVTRATSAETQLNININDEKTRAEGAEASLSAAISTLGGEVSAGGEALSGEIAAVSSALSTETSNRTTADTDLQTQITALSNKMIGVGQTWQNVASSRLTYTNYTNNTGKPIMVQVSDVGIINHGLELTCTMSGGFEITVGFFWFASGDTDGNISAIIPDGASYKVYIIAASSEDRTTTVKALVNWSELR